MPPRTAGSGAARLTPPPRSAGRGIERRGYRVAGDNAGLYKCGYLNPATGKIDGFEIDLVRELAHAIFHDRTRYRLVALSVPQRLPFVEQGRVDVVVDAVTITCTRRLEVDFSTPYYDAQQRVLVPVNSHATSIRDLAGQRVCASAQSAPLDVIKRLPAPPVPYGAPQAIDCLVLLQQDRVPAVSTDDAILPGFKA